ncbi:mitochondrial 37S ribosomal protein rsm10 [Pestalotiopsis sp. 9143b]|nr:mitochondrial 37S ribosomal protein rsm10 [Pestalotiopsis sp. 9143b]
MTRSRLIQSLARPLAQPSHNAFTGTIAASRSMADVTRPQKPTNKFPAQSNLPTPLTMQPELNAQNGEGDKEALRLPRAVQALYLQPLRRTPTYGVPTCDLQLRSYSIPNLEFFCDFALRAAYYLGLPAFGPVPLPKITERWTVPKSHFIFKKSQENFERITRRRLLQIRDGHPETVQIWLAFLQKHAYYGIGMKANVWEYSKMDVAKEMEGDAKSMQELVESKMAAHLGRDQIEGTVQKVQELLESERFRHQYK